MLQPAATPLFVVAFYKKSPAAEGKHTLSQVYLP